MGLDMYLYCNSKKVCQTVNDMTDEWEGGYQAKNGIAIEWRKANAIHKWFVDNCQGGTDDCGIYEVSVTDLVKLHDLCKEVLDSTELVDGDDQESFVYEGGKLVKSNVNVQVLEDYTVAARLLPTQGGFFFGSLSYDMYYWWDLQFTERKLAALLDCLVPGKRSWEVFAKDEPDWCVKFYYHSSW